MARRVANLLALAAAAAAAAAKCEVLRSLEFQQHTAPKGVSECVVCMQRAQAIAFPPAVLRGVDRDVSPRTASDVRVCWRKVFKSWLYSQGSN